jgi:hypothetical protein
MSTIKANNYEASTVGNNLIFKTDGSEKMRIVPNGTLTGVGVNLSGNALALNANGTTVHIHEPASGRASVLHCTSAAQGIGAAKGFICGLWSNNDAYCYTYDPVSLQFGTNGAIRMTVTSDGKVGIGTQTPSVALDVSGEARSSTSTTTSSNAKTLTTKDYVTPSNIVGVTHGAFVVGAGSPVSLFYTNQPLGLAKDTYTIPDGTWFLAGNMSTQMGGNSGNRVDAAFLNASGQVILRVILAGGNEYNGNDGGSGMAVRIGWCTGVPKNAKSVVFYRASGSNGGFDIAITTALTAYY